MNSLIAHPSEEVGIRAFDLLMKVIQEPERLPEQFPLKAELIVRQSTAG